MMDYGMLQSGQRMIFVSVETLTTGKGNPYANRRKQAASHGTMAEVMVSVTPAYESYAAES
jgi:hypothetical protein